MERAHSTARRADQRVREAVETRIPLMLYLLHEFPREAVRAVSRFEPSLRPVQARLEARTG